MVHDMEKTKPLYSNIVSVLSFMKFGLKNY